MSADKTSPIKYFLSGGFGGICTVLSGHPLDTIKVRLQTMPKPAPGESPLYSGTFDCARKTVKLEGFKGLYKGMAAPLIGVAPVFAISFFGFGVGKKLVSRKDDEELSLYQLYCAGAFSGFGTTVIMAPGERIKCLLQIQHGQAQPKYSGPGDVIKKLYKEGGIRSIYKGTVATLLRDVPSCGVYFLSYEWLQKTLKPYGSDSTQMNLLKTIFSGGTAGILLWAMAMPADVIKSRLQTAPEGKYTGIVHVFNTLVKEEGILALYKGVVPVMLRAFPANAACFIGFEAAMSFLNKVAPNL